MTFDPDILAARLARDGRLLAAYVLGSAVDNRLRPDSDLDMAILPVPGERLSPVDLMELSTDLSLAAGRTVDLGVLSSGNLVYATEALLTGVRFFCRDTFQADLVAATLLGLAAQFRYERREIVDAYAA